MSLHLATNGQFRHLLDLEHLPVDGLDRLLRRAQAFADGAQAAQAQLRWRCAHCSSSRPPHPLELSIGGAAVGGADPQGDASTSSATKGETDMDTLRTIQAMGVRGFVVRHKQDGAVAALAAAGQSWRGGGQCRRWPQPSSTKACWTC